MRVLSLYARKDGIEVRVLGINEEKGVFVGETTPKAKISGKPDYSSQFNSTYMTNLKISEWYFFEFC